jgi:hypothetical protein
MPGGEGQTLTYIISNPSKMGVMRYISTIF